ncbi:S66 peptidase family protein [Jeotgalibacillus salarius]|uniref:LD-carboxypeptidase n=1 Tax=Jeotgalibacillus salarius TaxID=546023 RepID=A0A4Y8LFQ2_9BACL|nr:LD-carboxypeptidase [Jeotgalibacillus salarius]TFD99826.1 LD-carboxypeptidase [Jeotgalibacillus salarius]
MILPKALKSGDTVGFIAPASPPDLKNMERSLAFFTSLGLKVKEGKHLRNVNGYLAGTDEERVEDLHAMFSDPEVKAVICAGGGYGTGRIADKIDYDLIRNHPKIFWGYSDITYLHTAIRQETGLVTFHGPMPASDVGKDEFHELSGKMFAQLFEPRELHYSEAISELSVIAEGAATGELTGGNLTLLMSTLNTKHEIDMKDKILLIEEVGEEPYRIDAMLSQLRSAGKLHEVNGIVAGDFKHAEPTNGKPSLSLEEVLQHYLGDLGIPVVSGFKIGHCEPHFSVPLGVNAKLSAGEKTLTLLPGVEW